MREKLHEILRFCGVTTWQPSPFWYKNWLFSKKPSILNIGLVGRPSENWYWRMKEITYAGGMHIMEWWNCPLRASGGQRIYPLLRKKRQENKIFMIAFDKIHRKEMNSEKNSSVCKQKCKRIKRVHKLKCLGRKRLFQREKGNPLLQRLIKTYFCSKDQITGWPSHLPLKPLDQFNGPQTKSSINSVNTG